MSSTCGDTIGLDDPGSRRPCGPARRRRLPVGQVAGTALRACRSLHWYERWTSIVSTWFFIRRGDLDDTRSVDGNDPHDLVQKAVGGWIREAEEAG